MKSVEGRAKQAEQEHLRQNQHMLEERRHTEEQSTQTRLRHLEETQRVEADRRVAEQLCEEAQQKLHRSERAKTDLAETLESLKEETRVLALSLRDQRQWPLDIDVSMSKHPHTFDNEVNELQVGKQQPLQHRSSELDWLVVGNVHVGHCGPPNFASA